MLAGGTVAAAFGLLVDPQGLLSNPLQSREVCQEVVQSKSVLSREQLSRLLTLPEGANQNQVRQVVREPYCKLATLNLRQGAQSRREAYPLAFDPQTWFVVMYEGESYAGYSFSFRH